MSIRKQIEEHLPKLGEKGVDALASELEKQAKEADAPWKGTIVQVFADSIQKLGPTGIALSKELLTEMLEGKPEDISKVTDNLATASDMLARIQKAEVRKRRLMRKFVRELGETLLHLVKAVANLAL